MIFAILIDQLLLREFDRALAPDIGGSVAQGSLINFSIQEMSKKIEYRKDLELLKAFLQGPSPDQIKMEVLQYFDMARPYFIPKREIQDLANFSDRVCDLIGGIPYTSQKNIWPVDFKTGEHLQFLLQLRLDKAGRLLGRDFGKGLIQIFGYSTEFYGFLKFMCRVVSSDDMRLPATLEKPDKIAKSIEFSEEHIKRAKICWRSAGKMLMGNLNHLKANINFSTNIDFEKYMNEDEGKSKIPRPYLELNESYEILDYVRSTPYAGTYLGGYGGGRGSSGNFLDLDPDKGILLIRTGSDEDDAHIGVSACFDVEGKMFFDVDGNYI